MATIVDVARRAGVALSTASDILNGKLKAKNTTAGRVRRAAEELGYRPNLLGRRLRTARAEAVGLVIPFRRPIFSSALLTDLLAGIQEEQQQLGVNLVLASRRYEGPGEVYGADLFQSRVVDGVLVVGTRESYGRDLDADVRALRALGCPLVWLHYFNGRAPVDRVALGGPEAMGVVLRHLAERGHRQVGFLEPGIGPKRGTRSVTARLRHQLEPLGMRTRAEWLGAGEAFDGAAFRGALGILGRPAPDRPSALVCHGDDLALAALQAALGLGLKVPQDLAIASLANFSIGEGAALPMTTFGPPARDLGRAALRRLQELIADPTLPPRVLELPAQLQIRATT